MAPLTSLVRYDNPTQVGAPKDAKVKASKDKTSRKVRGGSLACHCTGKPACTLLVALSWVGVLVCLWCGSSGHPSHKGPEQRNTTPA